jgi:hypothetical protein
MTPSRPAVAALRARLRNLYADLHSWRKVQKHYPDVNHETLRRIALTDYLPKERRIRRELGLIEKKQTTAHERRVGRKVARMAKETREEIFRKETKQ